MPIVLISETNGPIVRGSIVLRPETNGPIVRGSIVLPAHFIFYYSTPFNPWMKFRLFKQTKRSTYLLNLHCTPNFKCNQVVHYNKLAVPVRRWRPVMRRPVMPIADRLYIWPVQIHEIFNLPWPWRVTSSSSSLYENYRVIHRSTSPLLSRRNHACAIAHDQSRSPSRVYWPGSTLLNREETMCDNATWSHVLAAHILSKSANEGDL